MRRIRALRGTTSNQQGTKRVATVVVIVGGGGGGGVGVGVVGGGIGVGNNIKYQNISSG